MVKNIKTIPCDNCGARLDHIPEVCPECGEEIAARMEPNVRPKINKLLKYDGVEIMRFYLKWINPVIAVLIFIICTYVWLFGPKFPDILDAGENGIGLYFFAKGLFCSSVLFMFGEFLKRYILPEEE